MFDNPFSRFRELPVYQQRGYFVAIALCAAWGLFFVWLVNR